MSTFSGGTADSRCVDRSLQTDARAKPARPARRQQSRPSRERLLEPLELLDLGRRREEDELVTARLLVAADEVLQRGRARGVCGDDLLDEPARERVVVAEVGVPAPDVAEGEVALAPELGPAGAAEILPRRFRSGGCRGKGPRRAAAVGVAVRVARHPRERLSGEAADEQLDPLAGGPNAIPVHLTADVRELLGELPPAASVLRLSRLV